jgi:hypothetical protein
MSPRSDLAKIHPSHFLKLLGLIVITTRSHKFFNIYSILLEKNCFLALLFIALNVFSVQGEQCHNIYLGRYLL